MYIKIGFSYLDIIKSGEYLRGGGGDLNVFLVLLPKVDSSRLSGGQLGKINWKVEAITFRNHLEASLLQDSL